MGLKEEFDRQEAEAKTKEEDLRLANLRRHSEKSRKQRQEDRKRQEKEKLNQKAKAQFDESGLEMLMEEAISSGMAEEIDYKTHDDGTKIIGDGQYEVELKMSYCNEVDISVSHGGDIVIAGGYEKEVVSKRGQAVHPRVETLIHKKEWQRDRTALEKALVKAIRKPLYAAGTSSSHEPSGDGRNGR